MSLIMSSKLDQYSEIRNDLNNSTLLGTDKYQKTTNDAYYVLCRYKKPAPQRQVNAPPAAVTLVQSGDTEKNRQHQGMMGNPFQKVHTIAARRRDIMREIAHHQRPTPALEHSHCKWYSS